MYVYEARGFAMQRDVDLPWASEPKPDWLRSLPGPFNRTSAPGFVLRQVLPAHFARYIRIFPPFEEWDGRDETTNGRRRTWQDLAADAGVTFHAQLSEESMEQVRIDPGASFYKWSCPEGELDPMTERDLLAVLTGGEDAELFAYFSEVSTSQHDLDDVVWRVRPSRLGAFKTSTGLIGPEYIWPGDRSWLLYSNYDAPQTYLACTDDVAEAVLAHPDIESLAVRLDTRFDAWMDTLNGEVDRDWNTFASDMAQQQLLIDEMVAQALAEDEGVEVPDPD